MVRCADCQYEGDYELERDGMTFMRCQAPGGGPTANPISFREAQLDEHCPFFQARTRKPVPVARRAIPSEQTTRQTFEGTTLADVTRQVIEQTPAGMIASAMEILSDQTVKTARGLAATVNDAFEQATGKLPAGATIQDRGTLRAPRIDTLTYEAKNQSAAEKMAEDKAQEHFGGAVAVQSVKLVEEGSKGLFGIGGSRSRYQIEVVQPAEVEIRYTGPVRVLVTFSDATVARLPAIKTHDSLRQRYAREKRVSARSYVLQEGELHTVARRHPPGIPFVTTVKEALALALVRLEGLPEDEVQQLKRVIADDKVALVAQLATYPDYPVLSMAFLIYDDPVHPYCAEGFSNVAVGDVQDFLVAVARAGQGEFWLYDAGGAPLSAGQFTLVMVDGEFHSESVIFPAQPMLEQLLAFGQMIERAAEHLHGIPEERRDFQAAAQRYLRETYPDR